MALGDQAGKAAVDELVAELPALKAFIAEQLALIRSEFRGAIQDAKEELNAVVGSSIKALTVERAETIEQIADSVHELLDRVGATRLDIPARKVIANVGESAGANSVTVTE